MNQCWFAETIIAVKQKYELTVDSFEVDGLKDCLGYCDTSSIPQTWAKVKEEVGS